MRWQLTEDDKQWYYALQRCHGNRMAEGPGLWYYFDSGGDEDRLAVRGRNLVLHAAALEAR